MVTIAKNRLKFTDFTDFQRRLFGRFSKKFPPASPNLAELS